MNRLHKYLPNYYKESKHFGEITKVEDKEFDRIYNNIEDLNKQFLIETATWGLAIYEKVYGLPVKPNLSLDKRRSIIIAKMRGIGKVDNLMIKAIVEAFTDNVVTIEFNGKIVIVFDNDNDIDISSKGLYHSLEEVKPAHLDYVLENRIIRDVRLISEYRNGDSYIPPCNTIVAGTWWYLQNEGRRKGSKVRLNSSIKSVEFDYPETALYIVGEDGHIRHDFASQLTLEQEIVIKSIAKSHSFDYKKANQLIAGIYPELQNSMKVNKSKIKVKSKKRRGSFSYNETAQYMTGQRGAIRHDFASQFSVGQLIFIEGALKSTEFDFQETDKLVSGTFPDAMKMIKLLRRKFASNSKIRKKSVNYNLCGTVKTKEGFNG